MKNWLCLGNKKVPKCIHAEVTKKVMYSPLYANSRYSEPHEHLSIYCKRKFRFITRFITSCECYNNSKLEMFKNE